MKDNLDNIDKLTEQINSIKKENNDSDENDHIVKIKTIEEDDSISDTKRFDVIKEEKNQDEDLKIKIIENTEPPKEPKIIEYKENYIIYYLVIAVLVIIQIVFLYILFK